MKTATMLMQTLDRFSPILYTKETQAACDDSLLEWLGEERNTTWEENDCQMVVVKNPETIHRLKVWVNWYPLFRLNRWEDCVIKKSSFLRDLKPVTLQCPDDIRPPWSEDEPSCPCNLGEGFKDDFVEEVRAALEKDGWEVNEGMVNYEGV